MHLTLLTRTLDGPVAPTWVVRRDEPHTWGLDPGNDINAALRQHYRVVGEVCGHTVWLHDRVHRDLAAPVAVSECGPGVQ